MTGYPLKIVKQSSFFLPCILLLYPVAKNIGQFAMRETCENLLGLVNSCVYYVHQTREIYQALSYSADFKALAERALKFTE